LGSISAESSIEIAITGKRLKAKDITSFASSKCIKKIGRDSKIRLVFLENYVGLGSIYVIYHFTTIP
jgi:hypothetical protein